MSNEIANNIPDILPNTITIEIAKDMINILAKSKTNEITNNILTGQLTI